MGDRLVEALAMWSRAAPLRRLVHTTAEGLTSSKRRGFSSQPVASLRLYRVLQRKCQEIKRQVEEQGLKQFLLQQPLDPHQAGSSRIIDTDNESVVDSTRSVLQFLAGSSNNDSEFQTWLDAVTETKESTAYPPTLTALWVSLSDVQNAIRVAFRRSPSDGNQERRWAIEAFQQLSMQHQILHLTSISIEHNVRVSAISRCIGRSLKGHNEESNKYRFAYRMRIENVDQTECVQLLGRTWHIQEYKDDKPHGEPIRVHAPQTGAVGKMPVLRPGQAFEYMSGAELGGSGRMKGCFHFARVHPQTKSGVVGLPVEAFESPDRFEVGVQPFRLEADDDVVVFNK